MTSYYDLHLYVLQRGMHVNQLYFLKLRSEILSFYLSAEYSYNNYM